MDKVTSVITSNKKYLNNFLIFLIVVEHFPLKSNFPGTYQMIQPIFSNIRLVMENSFVKTLLFVVLIWSCCVKKDMDTFILMAIFFNTYYK